MHRRKQYEVESLEQSIRQRSEQQKKAGAELDATCNICLKTRFADGVGHVCHYCSIRCCARCGGKVTLRSNKVIFSFYLIIDISRTLISYHLIQIDAEKKIMKKASSFHTMIIYLASQV